MKFKIIFIATLFSFNVLNGQTMRYFEVVAPELAAAEWRDSSYVVAASDPTLIAEIETELVKPFDERRHVNGPIAAGDGGFNRNGDFKFNWHTKPNEWAFADFSIEVCDGRAYTDVNADTAYWIGNIGHFCGWSYRVVREVSALVGVPEPVESVGDFLPVVPNPANGEVLFSWSLASDAEVALIVANALGKTSITLPLERRTMGRYSQSFPTTALSDGVYFATLQIGKKVLTQRFIVAH